MSSPPVSWGHKITCTELNIISKSVYPQYTEGTGILFFKEEKAYYIYKSHKCKQNIHNCYKKRDFFILIKHHLHLRRMKLSLWNPLLKIWCCFSIKLSLWNYIATLSWKRRLSSCNVKRFYRNKIHGRSPVFVLGDFNGFRLNKSLPIYPQIVTCATMANKTIDLCSGHVRGA